MVEHYPALNEDGYSSHTLGNKSVSTKCRTKLNFKMKSSHRRKLPQGDGEKANGVLRAVLQKRLYLGDIFRK